MLPASHPLAALAGRRVAITGAAGFLGARVARLAALAGADVHALIRPAGDRSRLREWPGAQVHEVDLTDPAVVDRVLRTIEPDDVVHAAASPGHPSTTADRRAAWAVNTLATVHLCGALDAVPTARLVHVGSSTEYAPSDAPLREDDPAAPTTVRGASKLAAAVAVRQWAGERGRDATVVRPFSVYGPGEQPDRLVPTLLRCAASSAPFPMLDGVSRRDLVFVDDVAEGCLRALAVACPAAPVINLGTGVEHTVVEAVAAVERATGTRLDVRVAARPAQRHDVTHWVADPTRCRTLLGWAPSTVLADGLAATVHAARIATGAGVVT